MNVVKGKVFRLPILANQVNHHIRVLYSLPNRILIPQIVRMKQHLTQVTAHLKAHDLVVIATIRQDHLRALFAQFIANVATQEATAAKNCRDDAIVARPAACSPFHCCQVRVLQGARLLRGVAGFEADGHGTGLLSWKKNAGKKNNLATQIT